jgi:hypothetical protein
MAEKLGRKIMPNGHTRDDFECFGPPATDDGNFDNCLIADLGCFKQDGTDSNKFYHTAVVKSKKDGTWYTYFEWGRTGGNADFLFTMCGDKVEAQQVMAKQLHSKNDKRGEWATIAGINTLRAKAGKDCYLVRPAARRTTGLPDAQKVIHDDADQSKKTIQSSSSAAAKKIAKKVASKWDSKTLELGKALTGAVVDYTRKSFAGDYVPTQKAIDESRDVLVEAMKRVKTVGDSTKDQVKDRDLKELTGFIYSRIPKVKHVHADESTWILSSANIGEWQQDLDAFESALLALDAGSVDDSTTVSDPFSGFDLEMKWCDPKTVEGKFLQAWMPEASANRHRSVGGMKIRNMWALRQKALAPGFSRKVDQIAKEKTSGKRDKPKFQPPTRPDLSTADQKRFRDANVAALFHGTRTVNVSGILRTGLKLPKQLVGVAITGAMWGPGIYWADDWRKSDGYTSRDGTYWASGAGGISGRGAFMFVANVALGNPYVATGYGGGYTKAPQGKHCVAALGGHSGVQNNEWVVYNAAQNNLCYLVEYNTEKRSSW